MITLKNLETFVWVARLGGFGHTAKRLNTTQSAVSQRIAQLEGTIGTPLIDRQPRRTVVTPKGRELLPYAERMLRLHSEILHTVGTSDTLRGHIRLGVAETIAHTQLVGLVQKMQAVYPSVVVDIEVDVSTNLRDSLLRGDLDMIIPSMPILAPNVRNHDYVRYPMAWVAPPSLRLPEGPITLNDIARFPVITYPKSTHPYQGIRDMFLRAGIADFRLYGNTSLSAIARLCAGGIGVSVIPPTIIGPELESGELRIVEVVDGQLEDLQFTISYVLSADAYLLEAIASLALDHR
ncbi:LysR family transcriptional regulator [Candidimonas sp. SYP-B2681]|uniref:LysR family transcriptional regulator n=1 Tax=Candidimonas sp. SYP-B2681 TaxID=2497686 RepID=UPI00131545F4|nr:LysR family transcriptional regulator [Candidimonas sp. SYP-B2681]